MALSDRTQHAVEVALGREHGREVCAAVASGGAPAGAVVNIKPTADLVPSALVPIGDQTDLVGVDGAGSNAAPLAAVQTQIDTIQVALDATIAAVNAAAPVAGTEARLDALETKVDALLTSLRAASLLTP